MSGEKLYRVMARSLSDGSVREMSSGWSERQAEAYVRMAVMRRGVEEECFYAEPEEVE